MLVFRKPECSALTTYSPTGRKGAGSSPRSFVTPARVKPVRAFKTVTLAPGTTAPDASWMEIVIVPVATWQNSGLHNANSAIARLTFLTIAVSFR